MRKASLLRRTIYAFSAIMTWGVLEDVDPRGTIFREAVTTLEELARTAARCLAARMEAVAIEAVNPSRASRVHAPRQRHRR